MEVREIIDNDYSHCCTRCYDSLPLGIQVPQPVYSTCMPVASTIVNTLAPDSPEHIDFLHDSGVTVQLNNTKK